MQPFPDDTRAERRLDAAIHLIGVPGAVACAAWLLAEAGRTGNARLLAGLLVYAAGLVGMLSASAAYHLAPPGRAKEMLRRADHAAIFVMIAGSYTPYALNALPAPGGAVLGVVVWLLAGLGIFIKLAFPRRFEALSLALYLGMGWSVLSQIRPLLRLLPAGSLLCLIGGGVVYSVGALIYTRRRMKFHTPAWHALVLIAATLHLLALHTAFLAT